MTTTHEVTSVRLHFPEGTDPAHMHAATVEAGYALRDLIEAVAKEQGSPPLGIRLGSVHLCCDGPACPVQEPITDLAHLPEGWAHRGTDHLCPGHARTGEPF